MTFLAAGGGVEGGVAALTGGVVFIGTVTGLSELSDWKPTIGSEVKFGFRFLGVFGAALFTLSITITSSS